MATYTFSTKPMSRKQGRNAVAAAAYRSGVELADERTGVVHDYTRKRGVVHTEIIAAAGITPPDREQLWNAAEAAEKRRDARVAREYLVALPHELDADQRLVLAQELAGELVERYGVAVDLAVHAPDPAGDQRNHHAHLLATTRRLNHDGLGEKATIELSDKKRRDMGLGRGGDEVKLLRQRWESMANAALERADIAARIDCRSLEDQGIDRVPQIHRGPMATEQIRRGTAEQSDRALLSLEIDATNAQRQHLRERLDAERAVQEWAEITPATPPSPALDLLEPVPSPAADALLDMARQSARMDAQERIEQHIGGRHQLQIRASLRALERAQQQRRERIEQQEWEAWVSQPGVCRATGRIDVESRMMYQLEQSRRESQRLEATAKATTRQLVLEPPSPSPLRVFPLPKPKPSRAAPEAMPQERPKAPSNVSVALRQIDTTRQELAATQKRNAAVSVRLLDVQLEMRAAAEKRDSTARTAQEAGQGVATAQSELDAAQGWFKGRQRRAAQQRLDAAQERYRSAKGAAQQTKARYNSLSREYGELCKQAVAAAREVEHLEAEYQRLQQRQEAQKQNKREQRTVTARVSDGACRSVSVKTQAVADVRQLLCMPDQSDRAAAISSLDDHYADAYVEAMIEHDIGTFGELSTGAQQALDQSKSVQEAPDKSGLRWRGNEPMM